MEVRHFIYTGPPVTKTITVRQERAASPWRTLKVYPGLRMKVGKDIPERIAFFLMEMHGDIFRIEKESLSALDVVKDQFQDIVEFYKSHFDKDAVSVVPALLVEGLFSAMGDGALLSLITAVRESEAIHMSEIDRFHLIAKVFSKEVNVTADLPDTKPQPPKKRVRKSPEPKRKAPTIKL